MKKTLKISTLFNTPVKVTATLSLSQLFHPRTTFFMKFIGGGWVMYQLENKELKKAESLTKLLKDSFKVDLNMFYGLATVMTAAEKDVILEIFLVNDNYNLDVDEMYKIS